MISNPEITAKPLTQTAAINTPRNISYACTLLTQPSGNQFNWTMAAKLGHAEERRWPVADANFSDCRSKQIATAAPPYVLFDVSAMSQWNDQDCWSIIVSLSTIFAGFQLTIKKKFSERIREVCCFYWFSVNKITKSYHRRSAVTMRTLQNATDAEGREREGGERGVVVARGPVVLDNNMPSVQWHLLWSGGWRSSASTSVTCTTS